jgi:hypothetical protein
MQWVRLAFWSLASVSTLACTRGNPAFETSADETLGESETTAEETDEGTDTGTVAECEWDEGQTATIKLPQPCGETNENTLRYERSFLVTSTTENGWLGGLCSDPLDVDCMGDCPTAVPQAIEVGPFDVGGIAGAGACLRIHAVQADPSNESCSFDAIGIWQGETPIIIASNGVVNVGEAMMDSGLTSVASILAEDPPCECVEDCCQVSPGDHALAANGQTVPVGSPTQLADIPYVFHTLSAYDPTGCAGDLKQAWAMTYSPSP